MIDFLFATLSLTDKSTLRWCGLYQFILYFFFTLDSLSLSGTHVRSVRTGSYAPGSSGAGNRLLYMCSHELENFSRFLRDKSDDPVCARTYYGHFPVYLQVGSIFAGSFPEQRLFQAIRKILDMLETLVFWWSFSFRPFCCSASELFLGFFSGFKVRLFNN